MRIDSRKQEEEVTRRDYSWWKIENMIQPFLFLRSEIKIIKVEYTLHTYDFYLFFDIKIDTKI